MYRISRAISPASLALSLLALVLAASMTSSVAAPTAADQRSASNVKNNSVTTKKIKNNAVTAKKIRKDAVRANKIKNGAVTNEKIRPGTIDISRLAPPTVTQLRGVAGPAGPAGDAGPAGPAGAPGVSGYEIATLDVTVNQGSATSVIVPCPAGKKAIGGGYFLNAGSPTSITLEGNGPGAAGQTWINRLRNSGTSAISIEGSAVCITAN